MGTIGNRTIEIDFWVDPACPWCWATARWMVDEVQTQRNVQISWQPISLLVKNKPEPGSDYFGPVSYTHKLLRVMESIRTELGNAGVFDFYWECGRRIHHDRTFEISAEEILEAAGLPTSHAAAFDDEKWDSEIKTRMDKGLALTGDDVGTPILAVKSDSDEKVGLFGPVITSPPKGEAALKLFDGFLAMANTPVFWELKRTRTQDPDPGDRP